MSEPKKTSSIPDHVQGLHWEIDSVYRFAFNEYGGVDYYSTRSYGVLSRFPLDKFRKIAAAMVAAIEAYDQKPFAADVKVVNWALENATRNAESKLKEVTEAAERLRECLESARSMSNGKENDR